MRLPHKGVAVPVNDLIQLAKFHEKWDITNTLDNHPLPSVEFVSDGCSLWPDTWFGKDLYPACFWHDVRYWCGLSGDRKARLRADASLMLDVCAIHSVDLAVTMFNGVRVGGSEHLKTPFRWAYGRETV